MLGLSNFMWWEIRKIGSRKEQTVGLVFMGKAASS